MNKLETLNNKLVNHESVVDHVIGFYIEVGNQFSPSLNIPIFEYNGYSRVLIDFLGSMMWINVRPDRVLVGGKARFMAKNIQRKLEQIKSVTYSN